MVTKLTISHVAYVSHDKVYIAVVNLLYIVVNNI